jgi:hypothetical protein
MPLGAYLGRREHEHVSRWLAAQWAGRRAAPRCDGVTRDGRPCQGQRLYRSNFCIHHIRGEARDRIDHARRDRLCREIARTSCAGLQRRIKRQLRNIEHRALHRVWLNNPTIEGSTLELSPHEEERARAFLRDALGLDIEEVDRVTGRELSARAVDRGRWAAYLALKGRLEHEAARRRIVNLLRDERRYWARQVTP